MTERSIPRPELPHARIFEARFSRRFSPAGRIRRFNEYLRIRYQNFNQHEDPIPVVKDGNLYWSQVSFDEERLPTEKESGRIRRLFAKHGIRMLGKYPSETSEIGDPKGGSEDA